MPSSKERRRLAQQQRRERHRRTAEETQNPTISAWDSSNLELPPSPQLDPQAVRTLLDASTKKIAHTIFEQATRGSSPAESQMMLRFGRALREACVAEAAALFSRAN